ncbi:MAG: ComF family protein [Cyanobacteria bacterium]|nr:ComF family protein [Cyanobacteriota bacterium]MDW8200313.1 ComF family protein [Cyanobacteriota bacterium SKYGB_h_bin112]
MGWFQPLTGLLNLFLKSSCPLCQRSTAQVFCLACQRQLQHCQLAPRQEPLGNQVLLYAWGDYSGALRRAIAALKYENQPQIARPLGQWMGEQWRILHKTLPHWQGSSQPLVVPIPLHPAKQRKRGYNQAELLARGFCQVAELPLAPYGLQRIRETEAQFMLSAANRTQNLLGAFVVDRRLMQRSSPSVIILDDIYTTGATAQAAIQAFHNQGISVLAVVVLARAQLMSDPISYRPLQKHTKWPDVD